MEDMLIDRRRFLLGAAGLAVWPQAVVAESWHEAFQRRLQVEPGLAGWRSVRQPALSCEALALEGRIPIGLSGTFYRNGPARHDLGGERYKHWFDGDGMVHAFRITDSRISHSARMVETDKYLAETRAGRLLRAAFGTPGKEPVTAPDAINAANTSVLPFAGRLLALWEAGSAYALDPETLATQGPVSWRDDLKGTPFSAHPKIDSDGTLWNFGASYTSGQLILYRISPAGQLQQAAVFAVPELPMIHDFAITSRHLVFLLPPLLFDRRRFAAGNTFLDSHVWSPDAAMRVLVIDKSDWSKRRWFELPAGFLFHLGNAWEDSDGTIRFTHVRYPNAAWVTNVLPALMRGEVQSRPPLSQVASVTLDPNKGLARQELLAETVEFPRFDPRFITQPARALFTTGESKYGVTFGAILRHDLVSGALDRYSYGERFLVEEHIFVPRPGSSREADGWLIGTAFDIKDGVTVLSVFDAMNLAAGPIVRGRLPYGFPLGFHGNFRHA